MIISCIIITHIKWQKCLTEKRANGKFLGGFTAESR